MTRENEFSAHLELEATNPEDVQDDLDMVYNARKPLDLKDKDNPKEIKPGDENDPSTWTIV